MRKFFILCSALLFAVGAHAQDRTVALTLEKALEIALDDNPNIKIAGLEIERQRYVKKETWGNFLPSLSVDGSYTYAVEQSTMAGMKLGADNTVNIGGTATLPLIVPALFKTLKLNDEQMRAAVESARSSKITLVNEVKNAYYLILLAEQSLEVLRGSERTLSEVVDDTRVKFDNGVASEYDFITAQVQLSNLQPSIFEAENSIRVVKQRMKMLLDLPADVQITVAGTLTEMAGGQPVSFTRDVSDNSDLRALGIQADILKRQFQVLRATRMPTLAAFGNATFLGQDQIANLLEVMGTGAAPKIAFKWQKPINVGVSMSIPLFAGRTNVMRERQIKYSMQQLDYQKYYFEKGLSLQVENAVNAIATAREKMNANRKTIEQAQKGYDISKVRFDAGMGTILELNSAELLLTTAKLNFAQAAFELLSAQADYEKLIGKENSK